MRKIVRRQKPTIEAFACSNLHPLLQRVYANRGVSDVAQINKNLACLSPYLGLYGIDLAVDCLLEALQLGQRVLVVGDYDVDGATGVALMVRVLRQLGFRSVNFFVPNRDLGYGLSPEIVELSLADKPDLIVTVDNGISSFSGVEKANSLGIKVVITDHHLLADDGRLPAAAAVVNPNLPGDEFPSKNLAGVGVAFYLLIALRAKLRLVNWFEKNQLIPVNLGDYLDLVALGTIADMVALDQNNRILVHHGLQRIRAKRGNQGILSLVEVAKRDCTEMTADDLGFVIGPRLNAAGRMDDMSLGVDCLLANDPNVAYNLAQKLDILNKDRKKIEREMSFEAFSLLEKKGIGKKAGRFGPVAICVKNDHWHQGVIGILASRIKDKFDCPSVVFSPLSDTELKGSARSIKGINIRDVLDRIAAKNPKIIGKFGGHAAAAGLRISRDFYAEFVEMFEEEVGRLSKGNKLGNCLLSDGCLSVDDFRLETALCLRAGGPWGQAFPVPLFDGTFDLLEQRIVGRNHLKLSLGFANKVLEAIAFNVDLKVWPNERCDKVKLAYHLEIDSYRGKRKLRLLVRHLDPIERRREFMS
jgi:single-stranded-DNA-specific exonuclease